MDTSPLQVLIVAASSDYLQSVAALLTSVPDPFTIAASATLAEAVAACAAAAPDCALLAGRLPDADAPAAVAALRAAGARSVVVLAEASDEGAALEAVRRGAQDYLLFDGLTGPRLGLTVQRAVAAAHRDTLYALHAAVAATLVPSLDVGGTLAALARLPLPSFADACAVYTLDDDGHVALAAAAGDAAPPAVSPAPLAALGGPLGEVLRTGAPLCLGPSEEAPRSALVVPLHGAEGTLGALWLEAAGRPRGYDARDLALAEGLARRGADALTNARLRAEAQAAHEEAVAAHLKLQALVDGTPSGLGYLDSELRYVLLNPALAAINTRTPAEHLGRSVSEILPNVGPRLEPLMRQVLATGEPLRDLEFVGHPRPPHGLPNTWMISYFPIPGPAGDITGVGVTVTDVTELKRATAALRASEERAEASAREATAHAARLDSLLAHAPVGIALLDTGLRFQQINPHLAAMNGLAPAEHLGRPIGAVLPALAPDLDVIGRVLAAGEPVLDREVAGATYGDPGAERVWRASYFPVRVAGGPLLGVGLVVADITAERRIEEARRAEQQQLAAVLQNINEGVLAVRPDRTLALLNPAAVKELGLGPGVPLPSAAELVSAPAIRLYTPEDAPLAEEEWPMERVLRGERFSNLELRVRMGAQVEEHWISFSGTPVYDADGAIILGVITGQSITRRRRDAAALEAHAEALSKTNAELARALRLKDEFLAMMSHELRTPLNAVLGVSEALDEGLYGELAPTQRTALARVSKSGRHLLALLSDILDLLHIEAGAEVLDIQRVDVDSLCRTAVQQAQPLAQERGIRLLRSVEQGVVGVRGDERRLTQILVNLLDNAVKFTPAGGTVGLEISTDRDRECVQLVVWDTGIGIAEAERDRLFQPFTQVDGRLARRYGGIGLGLTLVRRLVDLHRGSVTLESAPGQGSRFIVRLPWAEEPPPAPRRWARPPRVLIADDHELTLAFYRDLLVAQGCQVALARSGEEALAQMRAQRPDVAVIDLQMPNMDGLATIGYTRRDPALAGVPIIALTALALPGDRERCLEAGARAYLAKPAGARALLATIAALIEP